MYDRMKLSSMIVERLSGYVIQMEVDKSSIAERGGRNR